MSDLRLQDENEFDAFNDDTFGQSEEWDEDAAAGEMAMMDPRLKMEGAGDADLTAGHDFFELKGRDDDGGLGGLEPDGLESQDLNGEELTLEEDRVDFDGISDSEDVEGLLPPRHANGSHQEAALATNFQHLMRSDLPDDPAIVNMVRAQPPMPPMMPIPPPVQMHPAIASAFPPIPVGMPSRGMPAPPQLPMGFSDPAIMAMGPPPPHLRHQQPPHLQQQPPHLQQQPPHAYHPHQRMMVPPPHQPYNNHHQHRNQPGYNRQQQVNNDFNRRHTGGRFPKNRNSFDDKNNETFGEDFVADHNYRQQKPQQRYQYGDRDRSLITPGQVQALGILAGAREGKIIPTGNPKLDEVKQREQDMQRFHLNHSNEDEYAGLMTQRDRQWIINIQLSQLKCDNPYIDDYYYTVYKLKREAEAKELAQERKKEMSKTHRELQRQLSLSEDAKEARMLRRDEEGAQLLLPAETSGTDGKEVVFKPQQFANSLGKLQAVSVKAPRKIIDVDVMIQEPEGGSNAQKDSR